jgi:hypothetical protein
MNQRIVLNQPKQQNAALVAPSPLSAGAAVVPSTSQPKPGQISTTWPFNCVVSASRVVTIPAPVYFGALSPLAELAGYLSVGRTYHELARFAFVEMVQLGYYAYERRTEWRSCALAAAYAGAFGPQAVERSEFSYSEAIWRLSKQVGYNLDQLFVIGPTGRFSAVCDEMTLLIDANFWSRRGVAEWLPTAAIVEGRVGS